jgi:iron complex transport system permease protein
MQALRNPLADPFILGVSSGASTGAVLVAVLGLGSGALGLSAGIHRRLVAFALVLVLARAAAAGTSGVILAGVAGTHFFSAVTSLIVFAFADSDATRGVMFWLLGSSRMRWNHVLRHRRGHGRSPGGRRLRADTDAFAFGDDVAASLGIHVSRVRRCCSSSPR